MLCLTASGTKQPTFWIMSHVGATMVMFPWQNSYGRERWRSKYCKSMRMPNSHGIPGDLVCGNVLGKVKKREIWGSVFNKANLSSAKPCMAGPCASSSMLDGSFGSSEHNTLYSAPSQCSCGATVLLGTTVLRKCGFVTSSRSCRGYPSWRWLHTEAMGQPVKVAENQQAS